MRYDLAGMAKRKGETRKTVVLRPIFPTKALSDDLARVYIKVLRLWRDEASNRLLPAYTRELKRLTADALPVKDDAQDIEAQILAAEARAAAIVAVLAIEIEAWERRLTDWHEGQFAAHVMSATGIDVSALLSTDEIRDTLRAVLAENIGLIRSVSDHARERIEGIIWRAYLARTPRRKVARQITHAVELGRDRALRIAVDQTTKLAGKLDELRQTEAGIESFEWRHSGKVHYRPEHKARDGLIYKWSSPIARSDPPGFAPFCGCKALPVLELESEE
jgi:SPP1 gp7 family putative phage head morphogenesis protein